MGRRNVDNLGALFGSRASVCVCSHVRDCTPDSPGESGLASRCKSYVSCFGKHVLYYSHHVGSPIMHNSFNLFLSPYLIDIISMKENVVPDYVRGYV